MGHSLSHAAPFRLVNIGGGKPKPLMDYIAELEKVLGKASVKNSPLCRVEICAILSPRGTLGAADWLRTRNFDHYWLVCLRGLVPPMVQPVIDGLTP